MRSRIVAGCAVMLITLVMNSCINIEEEPILLINPSAEISAHIKNQRIYATSLVNVNPQVLVAGNLPTIFKFTGELSIYNTENGDIIDVNAFTGGGLSKVYSVSAEIMDHERFVVIASGNIEAYANFGNDKDESNDKLISSGEFYAERQFLVSELDDRP